MKKTPKRQKWGEFSFGGVAFALAALYCFWRALAYGGMYIRKGFTFWIPREQAIGIAVLSIAFSAWCFWIVWSRARKQDQQEENDNSNNDFGERP